VIVEGKPGPPPPTTTTRPNTDPRRHVRRNLRASIIDGSAFSVMVGIGENYFSLFILASGLGQVLSGLVRTAPNLIGAVVQLATPWGVQRLRGLRRWTVLAATIQALSFVPLALMAFLGHASALLVFLAVTMYYVGGLAAGASWTTWIGQLVPVPLRSRYFARRAWPCQMGTLIGIIVGGLILEWASPRPSSPGAHEASSAIMLWYGVLFVLAGAMRAISARYLAAQTDTGPVHDHHVHVSSPELLRRILRARDGRLIAFMMAMNGAAQIAEPFLPAYLKDHLGMSYAQVLTLIAAGFVARACAQPIWGEVAHRIGIHRVLWIGTLGLIPGATLWALTPNFWALLAIQIMIGAFGAAYDLSSLILSLSLVKEHERTSLWSQYQFGNATVGLLGSLLGGAILAGSSWIPERLIAIEVPGAFLAAFFLSSVARALCLVLLSLTRFHEPEPDARAAAERVQQVSPDRQL